MNLLGRMAASVLLLAAAILMGLPTAASAQGAASSDVAAQQKAVIDQMRNELIKLRKENDDLRSEAVKSDIEYYVSFNDYRKKKLALITEEFAWRRTAANVILAVIVLIVLTAVGFSGYQLWHGLRLPTAAVGPTPPSTAIGGTGAPPENTPTAGAGGLLGTSINLSAQSAAVTTSVVGITILIISLGFFYLFLIEIYRFNVVDVSRLEGKTLASPQSQP